MNTTLLRASLVFVGLSLTGPLAGQSERDCQAASKLHAEQDLIKDLFAKLGRQTAAEGGPAIGSDPDSLQSRVREGLSSCQSNGGGSDACGNYKRVRDAWLVNNTGGAPGAAMITDPQTCEIENPDTGETVDPARDRPAGGFAQANWDSQYEHEKFHQANCRRLNGSGSNYYPGGPDSPYLQEMSDPRKLAEEEGFAHGITRDVLEDYLENNCFDPSLLVDAEDMAGVCGESPSSVAKIKSLAGEVKTWVATTVTDWLSVVAAGPVTTQPNGETEVDLQGDCQCCNGTTKSGEVRVYGGPGHSILLGKDNVNMGCAANNKCAGLSGDPHLRTYDGLRFDFQGAGEFVLARGEGFEVQARLEAWASRPVSLGTAVGARVNGDVVSFYVGKPAKLFVLGSETRIKAGDTIYLPGGSLLTRDGSRYRLTSLEGFVLEVTLRNTSLDLKIGLPINTPTVGLLGNFDGDRKNDIRAAAGSLLAQPVSFESLYRVFGAGWRVTTGTSLFEYGEGQSVDSFQDLSFPPERVQAGSITGADRQKAEAVCRKAGVTGTINMEDCILDVGLTGEAEFAEAAAEQPTEDVRLEVREPVAAPVPASERTPAPTPSASAGGEIRFDAPAEAYASHNLEIGIEGTPTRGYHIAIQPAGSDSSGRAANPYSERGLNGTETQVELIVPIIPGDYELRYLDNSRPRKILVRQPFRSLEPKVRIEAPVSAEAGKPFEVRLIGNIGKHMYVAVVPAGAPDEEQGRSRGRFPEGTDVTSRIRKLPEEPGRYEIRCSSFWGDKQKQVHARRNLTIY